MLKYSNSTIFDHDGFVMQVVLPAQKQDDFVNTFSHDYNRIISKTTTGGSRINQNGLNNVMK